MPWDGSSIHLPFSCSTLTGQGLNKAVFLGNPFIQIFLSYCHHGPSLLSLLFEKPLGSVYFTIRLFLIFICNHISVSAIWSILVVLQN